MIVVADTSPINYLILIEQITLLPALYSSILIPHAVQDELLDENAPVSVRAWAGNPPPWLEIASPLTSLQLLPMTLDPGETEAIALAEERHADWLLIDEAAGRDVAARRGLKTVGVAGILLEAHRRGMASLPESLDRLRSCGFYLADDLRKKLLSLI